MKRPARIASALIVVVLAFAAGYTIGDRPDAQLRAESRALLGNTAALGQSCTVVLDDNIRLARWAVERGYTLDQ